MFDAEASQFSHNYSASADDACEASRRVLLNQGYVTNMGRPDTIDATKDFQPDGDKHFQIVFHVVCVPGEETSDTSIVYANAVRNGYALKKSDTTASVGLSIIGSISMPIRSNSDEMVKVSTETIQADKFYERFFDFVNRNLKTVMKKTYPVRSATLSSTVIPGTPPAAASEPASSPAAASASSASITTPASPFVGDTSAARPAAAPPAAPGAP
jgi:hypothetical protein